MSDTKNLIQRVKQCDTTALESLVNLQLASYNVKTTVIKEEHTLKIIVKSLDPITEDKLRSYFLNQILRLTDTIERLEVTQFLIDNNEVVNKLELLKNPIESNKNSQDTLEISIDAVINRSIIIWTFLIFLSIIGGCIELIFPESGDKQEVKTLEDQEIGTVWECYKSVSGVYETLEYPQPRSNPDPENCRKVK